MNPHLHMLKEISKKDEETYDNNYDSQDKINCNIIQEFNMLTQKVNNADHDIQLVYNVSHKLTEDIQKWITESILRKFVMLDYVILQQNNHEIQQIIAEIVQGITSDEWRDCKLEEETEELEDEITTQHPSRYLANKMDELQFHDRLKRFKLWLLKIITELQYDSDLFNDIDLANTQERILKEISQWVDETIKEPLFAAVKSYLSCERLITHGWVINTANQMAHKEYSEQHKQFSNLSESGLHQQQTVTVKFISKNSTVFTKAYKLQTNMLEIKKDLYNSFNILHDGIVLAKDAEGIPDHLSLAELGAESYGTVEIELHCEHQIDFRKLYEDIPIPDVITVTIKRDEDAYDDDETKDIVVEIINQSIKKPYLGGYRNRITGIEYQHAFSQTKGKTTYPHSGDRFQRATQTYKQKSMLQNTLNNATTQVTNSEYYLPNATDKILAARMYETHYERLKKKDLEAKAVVIQKCWRKYKANLKKKEKEMMLQTTWEIQNASIVQKALEDEHYLYEEMVHRSYPHTKADFEMLYAMLDRWHKAETMRISNLKCEGPRRAEFMSLLEREVQLLLCIENYRIEARKEKMEKVDGQFLAKCARPITWVNNKGTMVSMETIGVQRARELQELYLILCQEELPKDERLDVIITLKYTDAATQILRMIEETEINILRSKAFSIEAKVTKLRAYSNSLTEELNALLDREYVLLSRGITNKDINSLHQRTKKLFSQLIKDPDFNPEATKHNTSYQLINQEDKLCMCKMCSRLLPSTLFKKSTNAKTLKVCVYCNFMQNISWSRRDMRPYEYIIQQLQEDERKRLCTDSIAFLMQDEDFYHLISKIWHNQSAISKDSNLFSLRLCRWNISENWSPWNCILLTENEMILHVKIKNVHQVYEQEFIVQVKQKHAVAKGQFQNLWRPETSQR